MSTLIGRHDYSRPAEICTAAYRSILQVFVVLSLVIQSQPLYRASLRGYYAIRHPLAQVSAGYWAPTNATEQQLLFYAVENLIIF